MVWILLLSLLLMSGRLDVLGHLVWFEPRETLKPVSCSLHGFVWIGKGTDAGVDVEVALLMCAWVGLAVSVASLCPWSSSSAVSWCSSGSTGVGLMVGRAVSEFLGWVLGLPVVHCWALAVSCSALAQYLLMHSSIVVQYSSRSMASMASRGLEWPCRAVSRGPITLVVLVLMFTL